MSDPKKPNSDSKVKGSEPLILYVGEDRGYWASFKNDFKAAYKQIKFRDEIIFETDPVIMQNLIVRIIKERPKAVFFDLSKFSEEVLHIVRVIVRSNAIIKPALFGLVDITTDKKYIKQGVVAGLPNIHVKTSEAESVVYGLVCTCFHDNLEEHGFAVAKMDDQATGFLPAKIGSMTNNSIHLESNFPITPGETYLLHTYWSENKTLVSPLVRAIDQATTNLYYNYEYAQNVKIVFTPTVADLIPDSDTISNDEYAKKSKELQEAGAAAQRKIQQWVENNLEHSSPKDIKVLVIDKSQTFYHNQPKSDEYPFVLRTQPYLKFPKKELARVYPHLVVYNMEEVTTEELEANEDISYTYNETRTLQYLVKSIKSMENYNPYIIVFNNLGHDTKRLQEVLMYPNIVSYKETLKPELVIKMAQLFQSKFKPDPNSAKTFVLNKSLQQSYAEYEFPIRILSCSETDMYFICDLDLKEGMLIRVTVPVPMYITVAKHPKNAKITTGFYGLINGLGEDVRMNLRKFVNSVFFRSLEEQKAAEKAEVERLKKEAMAKKAEEEKSRREAQERAKAAADKLKLESKQKEQDELEKKLDQAIKDDTDQAES